ncbi:ABC transporter substrate-binding protein [Oryzibacter oryziterrae]|uniref:ABC transporter substrate-binding protein n=1 Tax=Oryzibacter oryziterrae TaxID=2766474 RepID=UPI001F3CF724|nr:ABC transporter substrate-binding protein [Oryzibacter oryziterrae]
MQDKRYPHLAASGFTLDRRRFLTGAAALGLGAGLLPGLSGRAFADGPVSGGTLRLGMSGGSTTDVLDPRTLTDWVPVNVSYQIYNGLVEIDETNQAVPELLESWESKPGAAEWIFNVRKGVTFSNGKTLDADDIIYSINLHRGETTSGIKSTLAAIADVAKVTDSQIKITLTSGNADLPFILSDYHLMVVPKDFTDWANPIGTGGYVLESFDPGVRIVTKKRDGYWKAGRAYVDAIETTVIGDTTARTNALLTGEVDVINRLDPHAIDMLKGNDAISVTRNSAGQHAVFLMNCTAAPFDDVNVRMALKYGIDRQKIIDTVLRGYGVLGNDHPIPRTSPYHADLPQRAYDPDKAAFHLKKANLSSLSVDLSVSDAAFAGAADAGVLYQAAAAKAGITVNVKREPADGYWSNVWMKAPFCASYWGGRPTVDQMLSVAYLSDASYNDSFWKRPDFDKLVIAARTELDDAKRKELYFEAQKQISDDGGAMIPMFIDYLEASASHVKGVGTHPQFDLMGQRIGEKVWLEG